MTLKPIHDPTGGPLRTVALMSGSGTNITKILEHRERLVREEGRAFFEVAAIFSDSWDSRANQIGRDFGVPVVTHDLVGWMRKNGVERRELDKRERFDLETLEMLKPFKAPVAIYAGYMSIASPSLINAFTGVNVHPADLSAMGGDGQRRWRGAHAVRDAIAAGEKTIRSSTHLVVNEIDAGRLLMLSQPVDVKVPEGADLADPEELKRVADENQDRLKELGDWVIFPLTIEYIARGYFQADEKGEVYFKGEPVPGGLRLS